MLIIDDDDFSHLILSERLRATGIDVSAATDDATASALLEDGRYSVIVVDPYRAGADVEDLNVLFTQIRATNESAAIVILTSFGTEAFAPRLETGEIAAVIRKEPTVELTIRRLLEVWEEKHKA